MNVHVRTLYFYFTIAVFMILAPICVLYSMGYRIDWGARRLVQTGALIVSTIPRDSMASVDDSDDGPKKNPSRWSAIIPGTRTVRLEKNGFFSWVGAVQIQAKRSALIENAILFQSTKSPETILNEVPGPLAIRSNGERFAYLGNEGRTITRQNTTGPLADFSVPTDGSSIERISWSSDGGRLLVTRRQDASTITLSSLDDDKNAIERPLATQTPIEQAWWSAQGSDFLFTTNTTGLQRHDLFTGKVDDFFSGTILAFLPVEMGGYIIEKTIEGARLLWNDPTRQTAEAITPLSGTAFKFWPGTSGWFAIEDGSTGQCVLFHRNGVGPIKKLSLPEHCTFVKFHPTSPYALTGDGFELRLVALDTGERATLLRQSIAYQNVEWYSKGRVAFLANADKIEAIDLAIPSIVRTVLTESAGPKILAVDPDGDSLIFESRYGEARQLERITLQ